MDYFELRMDSTLWPFWFLQEPVAPNGMVLDSRIFTQARPYRNDWPLTVPIKEQGKPLDISFAAHDMIVVSERTGRLLEGICGDEVQRVPVKIGSQGAGYEILNLLEVAPCLDEENSVVTYWSPDDDRADKVGFYRMVAEIRIRPERTLGRSIFRISGWPLAVIVAENIKEAIVGSGLTGATFSKVFP